MVDPAYSETRICPQPEILENSLFWHYAPDDFELFQLEKMHREFVRAKRKVGWPGRFRLPAREVVFLRSFMKPRKIKFLCCGTPTVAGTAARLTHCSGMEYSLQVSRKTTVRLTIYNEELPALGSALKWRVLTSGGQCIQADRHGRTRSGVPPHLLEVPCIELQPIQHADGCFDAGREVYGWIEGEAENPVELFAGESRYEMQNENRAFDEQDQTLEFYENRKFRTCNPVAFRYFRFKNAMVQNVRCRLLFSPQQYKGAFRSRDGLLNSIWLHSAYTLRLNMHHFLLDGIKRDHMPWAGDLALSLTSNAYTFADGAIIRRSLKALGNSGPAYGDVNGITDFSTWWIICHELYQLYFGDREFLSRSYPLIWERVESLIARCNEAGFLVKNLEWVFIDWTLGTKISALQMLFFMALGSAARLAGKMNAAEDEKRWLAFAVKLKKSIYRQCFSPKCGLFSADIDGKTGEYTRHANLFALMSGLAEEKDRHGILNALVGTGLQPFGTPFLATWELLVLAESGKTSCAMEKIRSIWGNMLSWGATTFWEGVGDYREEKDFCEFYGRPFGASLCHAWASGPAFLLPRILLGLAPTADGWKEFRCTPRPGYGDICCTVPTPFGRIKAEWRGGKLHLDHPAETVCLSHCSRQQD